MVGRISRHFLRTWWKLSWNVFVLLVAIVKRAKTWDFHVACHYVSLLLVVNNKVICVMQCSPLFSLLYYTWDSLICHSFVLLSHTCIAWNCHVCYFSNDAHCKIVNIGMHIFIFILSNGFSLIDLITYVVCYPCISFFLKPDVLVVPVTNNELSWTDVSCTCNFIFFNLLSIMVTFVIEKL